MDLFESLPAEMTVETVVATAIVGLIAMLGLVADVFVLRHFRRVSPADPALGERLRATPWRFSEGLCCVLVLLTSLLLERMELQIVGLILILYTMRVSRSTSREAFGIIPGKIPGDLARGVGFYLAAFPVIIYYWSIVIVILDGIGYDLTQQPVVEWLLDPSTPKWHRIHIIIYAVTLAPLIEELFFRGVLLPGLMKHMHQSTAIFVVSAFFALMHWHLPTFVPLFMISWAFSLGYLYRGSIVVPIVMHMLFNGVNVFIMFMLKDSPQFI